MSLNFNISYFPLSQRKIAGFSVKELEYIAKTVRKEMEKLVD